MPPGLQVGFGSETVSTPLAPASMTEPATAHANLMTKVFETSFTSHNNPQAAAVPGVGPDPTVNVRRAAIGASELTRRPTTAGLAEGRANRPRPTNAFEDKALTTRPVAAGPSRLRVRLLLGIVLAAWLPGAAAD